MAILLACLRIGSAQGYQIGDLYTAPDGSQGIVFYTHPDGSGGWVVALYDASGACQWGTQTNLEEVADQDPLYSVELMYDTSGYANTQLLRNVQNNETYASGVVDFENGWYLPSAAQLRVLYGHLAFISNQLSAAGGVAMASAYYWSSSERNSTEAWCVSFRNTSNTGASGGFRSDYKTYSYHVRAVRSFSYVAEAEMDYVWNTGATTPTITVSPEQMTTYTVTVSTSTGCSETIEKNVIVGSGASSEFTVVTSAPYVWEGETYIQSGDYTRTFPTSLGCDSVVTLHLTVSLVFEAEVISTDDTICVGEEVLLEAVPKDAFAYVTVPPPPAVGVGDILCTDGTTVKASAYAASGKTAMGVVFYVDNTGEHGWAVHLNDQGNQIKWGGYGGDIPYLTNISTARAAVLDMDGYNNTSSIRYYYGSSTCPAAWAVDFDNGWYLPACGQLKILHAERVTVNNSIHIVNGIPMPDNISTWNYWSSTEATANSAYLIGSFGSISSYSKNYDDVNVRSIRSF